MICSACHHPGVQAGQPLGSRTPNSRELLATLYIPASLGYQMEDSKAALEGKPFVKQ
jgi:hypothetical protein